MKLHSLTTGQRQALLRLRVGTWARRTGGYGCPGKPSITLATAAAFTASGLAREELVNSRWQLIITPSGRFALDSLKHHVEAAS